MWSLCTRTDTQAEIALALKEIEAGDTEMDSPDHSSREQVQPLVPTSEARGPCTPGGKTLSSVLASDLKEANTILDLPENIYGAAMMAAIRTAQNHDDEHGVYLAHGVSISVFFALFVNMFMQAYVLYCTKVFITAPAVQDIRALYAHYHEQMFDDEGTWIHEHWDTFDKKRELCQIPFSQPVFFLALLIVWTATCWKDLRESYLYVDAWVRLPKPSDPSKYVETSSKEDDNETAATHASIHVKAVVMGFLLIPKVVISCFLWWLGARWLAATPSFQDLILNAVALAFIMELDELIYETVVPRDVMQLVQDYKVARPNQASAPKLSPSPTKEEIEKCNSARASRFIWRMVSIISTLAVITFVPMIYTYRLQQVIPDYKWDVHEYCALEALKHEEL